MIMDNIIDALKEGAYIEQKFLPRKVQVVLVCSDGRYNLTSANLSALVVRGILKSPVNISTTFTTYKYEKV